MTVTLKDVAKRAGVSIPTVSLIINGRDLPFKASTRRAVLEAVEALNYRPDSMARRNANGSNRRDAVALLLRSDSASRVSNTPVYEFICGVNDVCMVHNQFLVMMKLSQLQQQTQGGGSPRVIAERFVDGLIVETGLPPELELAVARYHIPTIWLNSGHHDAVDCIYPDEMHAGQTITEHLVSLGHRQILFVAPVSLRQNAHFSAIDRQRGYERIMSSHRLPVQVVYEQTAPDPQTTTGSAFSDLSQALKRILDSRKTDTPITAIVACDFIQAIRLQSDLQANGLLCPRDLSITAANDLRFLRRAWPELTGMSCDRYHMGSQAAEMMLEKISSNGQPQPSHVWRGSLIPGATAAPPSDAKPSAAAKRKTRLRV